MRIDIHIPHPMITLLTVAAVSGWAVALSGGEAPVNSTVLTGQVIQESPEIVPVEDVHAEDEPAVVPRQRTDEPAQGGDDTPVEEKRAEAEFRIQQIREEQGVIQAKEEILRYQLEKLQEEREGLGEVNDALEEQFRAATRLLTSLLQDSQRAERYLLTSLNQLWDAEGKARALAQDTIKNINSLSLLWPVEVKLGISAYFHDKAYEQRFKMQHNAVDIPVPQGTLIAAAAGGIVKDVADHGLGFNYITIEHPGGYATLYGHLTKFTVKPGDHVIAGDPIGYSGGRPGTPGAGFSTGPHLHFGVYINGAAVDPLPFLPAVSGAAVQEVN